MIKQVNSEEFKKEIKDGVVQGAKDAKDAAM